MNRTALVTGAASLNGIGYAIARSLAADGLRVILTDIAEGAVMERAKELRRAGLDAQGMRHDVTSEADWHTAIMAAERLDVLVNNAAIAILKPLDQLSATDIRRSMDANITGVLLGCQQALAAMRTGGGVIVNISSVSALIGFAANAAYGATKGAMRSLSKSVALEGAPYNIRCNSVHPGAIWTDLQIAAHAASPLSFGAIERAIPLARIGDPRDVGHLVAFLASPKASYITAAEFVIDGGLTGARNMSA